MGHPSFSNDPKFYLSKCNNLAHITFPFAAAAALGTHKLPAENKPNRRNKTMKVSFSSPKSEGTATTVEDSNVAVIPHQDKSVVVAGPATGPSDMDGEFTSSDFRLPRLNLVQKVGQLSDSFDSGSIILNKEIVVSDGKTPVTVIALRMKKQYQEALPYGSDDMPRVFDTAQEVRENGGTVAYGKGAGVFGEVAHIEMLVAAPAGLDEDGMIHFAEEVEGKPFARVIYTAASTAYSGAAKPLITARGTHLKDLGLSAGKWELTTKLNVGAKNSWYTPVLKAAGVLTPEGQQETASLIA